MKKMMSKKIRRRAFTLIELIVSMAVFALLSMMVVQLFSASQKLWVSNNQKNAVSAEGRTALNQIASLLSNACAAPEIHAQQDASNSTDTVYKGGSDYLELATDSAGNSQLYFATKSSQPGIKDGNSSVSACFIGVQVVEITSSSDPDYGYKVLVMTAKTDTDTSGIFEDQFPVNDDRIRERLDLQRDSYSEGATKISRIAAGVISFRAWLSYNSDDIRHVTNSSAGETSRSYNSTQDYPVAVELELVLMDREHYLLYDQETDSDRQIILRDQYSRTFRKLIWLGSGRRVDDYSEYHN